MVRICIIVISLSLMGCFGSRTEYGRKRTFNFERPNGEINRIVYTLVDTAKLYEEIPRQKDYPFPIINKIYLKFYANGKVGEFLNCDMNDITSLNPRKADMGYYWYNEKGLQIKTFFEHPQGGGWLKRKVVNFSNDTLCIDTGKYQTKYKGINLPKKFLVFTPDW